MVILVKIKYSDNEETVYTILKEIDVNIERYKSITDNNNFIDFGCMIYDRYFSTFIYYIDTDNRKYDSRLGNTIDAFVREKNIEKLI